MIIFLLGTIVSVGASASIAQRIEQGTPKPEIQVRFLVGAQASVELSSTPMYLSYSMKSGESLRLRKVNELIGQQLSELLGREIGWKSGVIVTISKVKTTADLRQAHVFISAFPAGEGQYVMETLRKEAYALQGTLNRRLHMRPLPRVVFELDTTEEQAQSVEDILKDPEF